MTGQDFERSIVHAFNNYASNYDTKLIAYRHLQTRYQPQLFDVLVDSEDRSFYFAIECKSIDPKTVNSIYFKQHFSTVKGVHQLERENNWLSLSGRHGLLLVELRATEGKRTTCFCVPFGFCIACFQGGDVGLTFNTLIKFPRCVKSAGKYNFDDVFMYELHEYLGVCHETIP